MNPLLYPDIAAAGSLRVALQNEFAAKGIPLEAQHTSSPGWLDMAAEVRAEDRRANVVLAQDKRSFTVGFRMRGVPMGDGSTVHLEEVATSISVFLSGATLRQLSVACPFVRFGGFSEAYEQSEAEAIVFMWQRYLEPSSPRAPHLVKLYDYLAAAAREPRLRALRPFTSHWDLGFRESFGDCQPQPLAWVRPFGDGQYLVAGPDRRQLYSPGPIRLTIWGDEPVAGALGPASAQDAVALTVEALDRA